eukprot:g53424.t1
MMFCLAQLRPSGKSSTSPTTAAQIIGLCGDGTHFLDCQDCSDAVSLFWRAQASVSVLPVIWRRLNESGNRVDDRQPRNVATLFAVTIALLSHHQVIDKHIHRQSKQKKHVHVRFPHSPPLDFSVCTACVVFHSPTQSVLNDIL